MAPPPPPGRSPRPPARPAVGVDVAGVARLADVIRRRPRLAERIFSAGELADCAGRPERLAARWAAKEAVRKLAGSLGLRPLPGWRAIEVERLGSGAPRVRIGGRDAGIALSLSHDAGVAVAVALAIPGGRLVGDAVAPAGLRLPERPDDANKGSFGTVTVLAGAHGFSGAAYLAAMGAARGGAGRVRLCVPAALHPVMAVKCTEVMPHPLPDGGAGTVGEEAVAALLGEHLPTSTSLVVGPGLGQAEPTGRALRHLLERLPVPTVVDADALNLAAGGGVDWRRNGQPLVLTPHPAEMGRLAGMPTRDVQANRRRVALDHAARWGVVVVLKGAETVVAAPDGRLHTDAHRLVSLATGGTGDVLAGLCGAMLAGGLEAFDAAVAAVTIHAEAGSEVQATQGRAGGLASDLLEALPRAQERLRQVIEASAGDGGP